MMTEFETIQAIRKDIVGEYQAIVQYSDHINTTNNSLAKKVWTDIRGEEQKHIGELTTLLFQLDPDSAKDFMVGKKEVEEMLTAMSIRKRI